MTAIVYIIGTAHQLQAGHKSYTSEEHEQFRELVLESITKFNVLQILEEMSPDVISDYGVENSIAWQVAVTEDLEHDYIDLTAAERADLGFSRLDIYDLARNAALNEEQRIILEGYGGNLREYVWVVRILKRNCWPALFICGSNHALSIKVLLDAIGIETEIIASDFDPHEQRDE